MRCTTCGAELIAGKQFCHACGTRVAARCRGCGAPLEPTFRFCPDCGLRVGADVHDATPPPAGDPLERLSQRMPSGLADKILATRGAIEGERKQVTVLFCDLAGSTAIAERLDPEEYHELLDRYLELAFREIYRFEGIVNQLAGDGMMALFGAPVAHEDAPQRAVRAALAIHEALGPLAERVRAERGLELRVRIGINTGPVVVGGIGNDLKMDYSAVGDTTNLAARLEALARPGTVLISETTMRLVRGFFEARPAGPYAVKGKSEAVTAYEVVGRAEAATPMTIAEERGLTPFVGRDDELAQLESCYRRLATDHAQVVAVVGDAGSGKSRLLYEFKRRLADEPTVCFEARCSSMSQAAPYHPFVQMLRTYFGLLASEPPARAREKVAARLGTFDDRLERRFPLLCRFMVGSRRSGADADELPPDQLKRESFEAVTGLVLTESARGSVVMMIEDLQWMDDASRELLATLLARLERARVMVVLSHRPFDHPGWRTPAAFTQLVLRRLADEDVAAIIRSIACGVLPPELARRLVAKAEGSPFFAEEMTHALIEEGHLVCDGGSCRMARPLEEVPIPGTVQEVIAARLDRLGPQAKRVIQVAAVLGRQFGRADLARLLEGEDIDVTRELGELERRGLLHRKHLLSSDEYRFGESVTQEVAYEGLLLRQRRTLHERIGAMLEAATNGHATAERSALLAHHYARSDNRPKAIEALVRAGRDALELPSYRTAADYFRRAWELWEAGSGEEDPSGGLARLALEAMARFCAVTVLFGLPYVEEAARAAERGRPLAEALGDVETLSGFCYFHGAIMMMGDREQFARGLALAEEGLAIAQRAGLAMQAVRLARGLSISYVHDGRFDLARRVIDWVLGELQAAGDGTSDVFLSACWVRDFIFYASDDLDAAAEHAAATYALAERVPNRTIRGAASVTLAAIHFLRGEYAEAKRWADVGLEVSEQIANLSAAASAAAIAVLARLELGEPVAPERYLEVMDQGAGVAGATLSNLRLVGEAFLALDDLVRAERYAEQLRGHVGGRLRDAHLATLLGEIMTRRGRHDVAERHFAEAIGAAEAIGVRSLAAAAALGAAELAAARGDAATAARHRQQARTIATELRLGRYLARARRLPGAPEAVADRAV